MVTLVFAASPAERKLPDPGRLHPVETQPPGPPSPSPTAPSPLQQSQLLETQRSNVSGDSWSIYSPCCHRCSSCFSLSSRKYFSARTSSKHSSEPSQMSWSFMYADTVGTPEPWLEGRVPEVSERDTLEEKTWTHSKWLSVVYFSMQ